MTKIKEIFSSIQGEGPYIGYKQLFVRFCSCNLHCDYCDTDFESLTSTDYSVDDLVHIVNKNLDCHSVSLTGGEPLLSVNFLKDFLPQSKLPVYLETNSTLYQPLKQIINYVDYIAADIKLPSCTGLKPLWEDHDKFFDVAQNKILFAKVVFDSNITSEEIFSCCNLAKKYNIELILQPKMEGKKVVVNSDFMQSILDKSLGQYKKVRLIPQVHKFIDVE